MFQKYLFEVLERKMHRGLTYSATSQIYWVTWNFPILSPNQDIPSFAQKRLIELSKFWSVKYNLILFIFCRGIKLILSIRIIYGWLDWFKKNEVSRLHLEKTQLVIYLRLLLLYYSIYRQERSQIV